MLVLKLTEAAKDDYLKAKEWYSDIHLHLGEGFDLAIDEAMSRVIDNPKQFAVIDGDTRRVIADRFPFSIFYVLEEEHVIITAILHQRRSPGLWKR